MSVASDLYTALAPLVGNRCYPVTFPLTPPNPQWPAIRYTPISIVPPAALCGNGGDDASDFRAQLDLVAVNYSAVQALRTSVMAEMVDFEPPAILENSFDGYDAETKTYRVTLDYVIYASAMAT